MAYNGVAVQASAVMPELVFKLKTVAQILEDGTLAVEALGFPGTNALSDSPRRANEALRARAADLLRLAPPYQLHRQAPPQDVKVTEATIELTPPHRSPAWEAPLTLRFDILQWSASKDAFIALVPELKIHVVANKAEDLPKRVESHIRFALKRVKASASLWALARLQRVKKLELAETSVRVKVPTPVETARGGDDNQRKESILKQAATELRREDLEPAFEVEALTHKLADALGGRTPRSVLLVGPSGCGKTAAIHELVRNKSKLRLGSATFWSSDGPRLVAGKSGFGMWQEHCQNLAREASHERATLHLGNLFELMEVGKSEHNQQGVASFLRPYIARGDLQIIVECAPEQLSLIERADPHLLEVLFQIQAREPDVDAGRLILMNCAAHISENERAVITDDGLETLDRLHRRYASYSAYPGRPLRFLKNAIGDKTRAEFAQPNFPNPETMLAEKSKPEVPLPAKPLDASDITAAFSRETGLPLFMLDDAIPLDLSATRARFAANVIGQREAVDLVCDQIATVKARLSRPRKPIASLMFIGPTGVGKTEMAKALAEFLFGDRERLTRFDMSEFGDEPAVQRLIGGASQSEGLMTAKVREQPFSVILLDEFEKADPSFYDLMLQVLGEGRLTDSAGRVADFSNALIIMTSNLGAASFQKGAAGFVANSNARRDARDHFSREVQTFLRPEMFNRIDRIVPFAPLDEETVLAIARREIDLIRKRDGIALRDVSLEVSEGAIRHLATGGFDVRYGARPLKRTIELEMLAPLSDGINGYASSTALSADVTLENGALKVHLRSRTDDAGKRISATAGGSPAAVSANAAVRLRRDAQRLRNCAVVRAFENQISFLESLKARLSVKKWTSPEQAARLKPLPRLKNFLNQAEILLNASAELEQTVVSAIYERDAAPGRAAEAVEIETRREEWNEMLRRAFWLRFPRPDDITLAIYGDNRETLWRLTHAYFHLVAKYDCKATVYQVRLHDGNDSSVREQDFKFQTDPVLVARKMEDGKKFFRDKPDRTLGVIFAIKGFLAFPRFQTEAGAHSFQDKDATFKCLVHASDLEMGNYEPPAGAARKGVADKRDPRRVYHETKERIEDAYHGNRPWSGGSIDNVLHAMIEAQLDQAVKSVLE